jgi:hypothetical protein
MYTIFIFILMKLRVGGVEKHFCFLGGLQFEKD